MQTFLPYPNYELSASSLDRQRLGKQRVEAMQIYRALSRRKYRWQNHPATHQWRGHRYQLCLYGMAICKEWRRRGYRDSLLTYFKWHRFLHIFWRREPWWLDFSQYHKSHRAKLYWKNPDHYEDFLKAYLELVPESSDQNNAKEPEYFWPSKEGLS